MFWMGLSIGLLLGMFSVFFLLFILPDPEDQKQDSEYKYAGYVETISKN